jgi:hypothetical protein
MFLRARARIRILILVPDIAFANFRWTHVRVLRGTSAAYRARRTAVSFSRGAARSALIRCFSSLDIFAPHQHQLGLHIDLAVLRESLTQPAPSRRFGCLLNVVWVWACFLSRPGPLASSEAQYVKLALESLQLSLAEPKRLVDVVLASSLLAKYFYMCGRVLEGSYHHGAAAALAVRWDLHRAPGAAAPSGGCFSLPPCKDQREEGERIVAFWMVHDLDRCWNTVMTRVPSVPDSLYIDAPWPQPAEDYQNVSVKVEPE